MFSDNQNYPSYSQLMAENQPYITLDLDLKKPVELIDFVGFFGSVSNQFDRYMRAKHPDVASDARFFVKEVRKGSIIVDLFPGGTTDIIQMMDNVVIVAEFAALVGAGVGIYIKGGWKDDATKAELKDFLGTVEAVANDPDGKATIKTAVFEKGVWRTHVAMTFSTQEAKQAVVAIEGHKAELDKIGGSDFERVLMYFKRTDSGEAAVGKRSGERVVIEAVSNKDLALIYGSNLVEERIKDEIRHSIIFQRGFVVDVNVQTKGGKPAAYSVTHIHDVIDLPDD